MIFLDDTVVDGTQKASNEGLAIFLFDVKIGLSVIVDTMTIIWIMLMTHLISSVAMVPTWTHAYVVEP